MYILEDESFERLLDINKRLFAPEALSPDERRDLAPHANVSLGRDDIRGSGGSPAPVPPGVQLVVLPSVSGG